MMEMAPGLAGGGGERGGRGGAAARRSAPAGLTQGQQGLATTGTSLQYKVLRLVPGGGRVAVAADGNVPAGSAVILQITPAADGYIRILGDNGRQLLNRAVRGMQPVETRLPNVTKPARVPIRIAFSTLPFGGNRQDAAGGEPVTIVLNYQ
jgi:hypothetical protein